MEFWGQQVIDFAAEVGGASATDKAVVAGNSIGRVVVGYQRFTTLLFVVRQNTVQLITARLCPRNQSSDTPRE
jgi:hypothetical protein